MISLKELFKPKPKSRDGLTQGQREAIIDLLNYCSFVDHDIARAEDVMIEDLEFELDWDSKTDFDYYINKSVGFVRGAIEGHDQAEDVVKAIRGRLDSRKSRKLAIALSEKLVSADGKVTAEETETLKAIKKGLG